MIDICAHLTISGLVLEVQDFSHLKILYLYTRLSLVSFSKNKNNTSLKQNLGYFIEKRSLGHPVHCLFTEENCSSQAQLGVTRKLMCIYCLPCHFGIFIQKRQQNQKHKCNKECREHRMAIGIKALFSLCFMCNCIYHCLSSNP